MVKQWKEDQLPGENPEPVGEVLKRFVMDYKNEDSLIKEIGLLPYIERLTRDLELITDDWLNRPSDAEFDARMMRTLGVIRSEFDRLFKLQHLPKNELANKLYDVLPNSPLTDIIKRISISLPVGRQIAASKNVKVKTEETLNGKYLLSYAGANEEYEISIDNVQVWKSKRTVQLRKTLNFLLIKANEQNYPDRISFQLDEYMKKTGIDSKDAAYRAAKRELDTLLGFTLTGVRRRGKKEVRNTKGYVFTMRDISYNECYVECKSSHVEMLCQYYSLLPQWAGELKTIAYDIVDYIYYMARQKNNQDNLSNVGHFNISLKALNNRIGGYDPAETHKHTEYIINPILEAVTDIEDMQNNGELKITPMYDHDYKNAYGFLDGYLKIEMEPTALNYYLERDEQRKKEIKKRVSKASKKD